MRVLNDEIIRTILTSKQNASSIHELNWRIEDITEKNSNNYTTKISRIKVLYNHENSPLQESTFFLKVPSVAFINQALKELDIYGNEVLMYTKVLPQMYTIEDDHFTPKQYYFDDKKSLVLEDLSKSGYKCANRGQNLDIEHCFFAIRCLAKFHALSIKLENTVELPKSVELISVLRKEKAMKTLIADWIQQVPIFIDSIPQHLKDL